MGREAAWRTRGACAKLQQSMANAPKGSDGKLHPNKVLSALQQAIGNDSVVITDGGDFLAFARVGLSAPLMLDPGPVRLHRHRRALWHRRQPRLPRQASRGGDR